MRDLIAIGRFAQLTQLTIKALHIYDAIGLLRPVFTDTSSGYRYYSITQLPLARRIRLLRSIDMSLDSIHAVLHAPTPAATDALLREHQQRIADRIMKDQQALHLLQHIIDHQADDLVFTVQIKDVAEQPVASMRLQATPEEEQSRIPALLDALERYTAELGARRQDAPPIRISHAYTEAMVDTEIAVPITQLIAGTERIAARVLEASAVAYVMHVGPHADLWAVYWALLVWIQEHGYEPCGSPREIYWRHPADGHTAAYRTEVQWPIRSSSAAAIDTPGAAHAHS
jgi:DNA-binding transcriptional MerR regulator